MDNKIYDIKLGQWRPTIITKDKTLYQCSECGNIDKSDKEICSNCKAKMIKGE